MSTAGADRSDVAAVVARGDEEAFRRLYRRHGPALYQLALRLAGGDVDVADDLAQESWVQAARALGAFAWRSELRTWLSGFVVNAFRRQLRERGRALEVQAMLGERGDGEDAPGFIDDGRTPIDPIDLERAIARLPDGYRAVLVLHDIHGRTHEEIGELLGIVAGSSKSQLARGRAQLRRLLMPSTSPSDSGVA